MSRVGKKPIVLPENVTVNAKDGLVEVGGPKGKLSFKLPAGVKLTAEGKNIRIETESASREEKILWGTVRALVANMVTGVTDGYERKLEIEGIGFKAQLKGNDLVLSLGFSHPVEYQAPAGISFKLEKNVISILGIDKAVVGEVAASIRQLKKPEPYKGKGIRYQGEIVRRKAGKKVTAAAA